MNFNFVPNEGLMVEGKHVAKFDVKVNRIFYYIQDDAAKKSYIEYELVARKLDGTELPARRVKKLNNLSYFSLWTDIMDAELERWEKRMLLLRLQTSCKDAEQIKVYHISSNGYQTLEDDGQIFIAGDYEYVSKKKGLRIQVDEKIKQMKWKNKAYAENTKYVVAKEVDYLMVSPGASEILFTAILLSAIKFLFVEAGFNPSVCINLYGKTGSYKTALTQAMMYMENPSYFMCSLVNDQKKMAVRKVQECYGFPVVLEDYHAGATGYDYKRQISMMDAVVRHIEGNPQSAVVFITSEFLDGVESLQARTLQIEAQDVDLRILTKIQREQTMADIIMNFLTVLLAQKKDAIETIQKQYENLSKHGEKAMRIEESIAFLKITGILYGKYVDKDGKLSLSSKLDKALELQKEKQRLHLSKVTLSDEEKVIKVVYEMLKDETYTRLSHQKKLAFNGEEKETLIFEGCMCLSRKALAFGMQTHDCMGLNINKVILTLSKLNLLDEDRGGTYTKKVCSVRVYSILFDELKEKYEALESVRS